MSHGVARTREISKIAHDRVRPYTSGKGALLDDMLHVCTLKHSSITTLLQYFDTLLQFYIHG